MILARALKAYRKETGHTLRSAAKLIGVNHNALQRFENGHPLDGKNLATIIKWLLSGDLKNGKDT